MLKTNENGEISSCTHVLSHTWVGLSESVCLLCTQPQLQNKRSAPRTKAVTVGASCSGGTAAHSTLIQSSSVCFFSSLWPLFYPLHSVIGWLNKQLNEKQLSTTPPNTSGLPAGLRVGAARHWNRKRKASFHCSNFTSKTMLPISNWDLLMQAPFYAPPVKPAGPIVLPDVSPVDQRTAQLGNRQAWLPSIYQ